MPGFANFAGEMLVLFGAWASHPTVVSLAAWAGLILGAVYALRAARVMLHGNLPERWNAVPDAASAWRRLPYALLLTALVVLGCFPRLLTDRVNASAQRVVEAVHGAAFAQTHPLPGSLLGDGELGRSADGLVRSTVREPARLAAGGDARAPKP